MKKIIILSLFSVMVFSQEFTIGFSQATLSNDWLRAQLNEMKSSVKNHKNLKLFVKNADGKVSKQVRDIEEFIQMGLDFIIAMPLDTKITALAFQKAIKKGIKVILISRTVDTDDYTAFIGPNNFMIANDAAKILAKKLSFKGKILMLKGIPSTSSAKQRSAGFLDTIKEYPKIQVIEKTANYLRSDAMKVMEELYKNNIEFDAIYSHSDSMLIGARNVMKKYEKNLSLIPSVSIDYIKQTQEAIQGGEQFASYLYPTSAKEGIETVINLINQKKVPKVTYIKSILVTKENAHLIEPIF